MGPHYPHRLFREERAECDKHNDEKAEAPLSTQNNPPYVPELDIPHGNLCKGDLDIIVIPFFYR